VKLGERGGGGWGLGDLGDLGGGGLGGVREGDWGVGGGGFWLVGANVACLCRQFLQEANAKPEAKH